jgi:hypothetical protein
MGPTGPLTTLDLWLLSRETTPKLDRGSRAAGPPYSSIIAYVRIVWIDQNILSGIQNRSQSIFRAALLQTRHIAAIFMNSMI